MRSCKNYRPGCVKKVILRGDGEFIGWEGVEAALEEGDLFLFGNKGCRPPFDRSKWYKVREADGVEYNECLYQPMGWKQECRFVAMCIPEDEPQEGKSVQLKLFEDDKYIYRIFVTNKGENAHKVIEEQEMAFETPRSSGDKASCFFSVTLVQEISCTRFHERVFQVF